MFESANDFSMFIELDAKTKNIPVLDAVLEFCEENYIDPIEISKFVNKSLKDKLEINFIDSGFLPKSASLEI